MYRATRDIQHLRELLPFAAKHQAPTCAGSRPRSPHDPPQRQVTLLRQVRDGELSGKNFPSQDRQRKEGSSLLPGEGPRHPSCPLPPASCNIYRMMVAEGRGRHRKRGCSGTPSWGGQDCAGRCFLPRPSSPVTGSLQLPEPFPPAPLSPHTLCTNKTSPSSSHQNPLSFSTADPWR